MTGMVTCCMARPGIFEDESIEVSMLAAPADRSLDHQVVTHVVSWQRQIRQSKYAARG